MSYNKTKTGIYKPVSGKCLQTATVKYRSSYELTFCIMLDKSPMVSRWEFEQTWVRYKYAGKSRGYLIDFTVYLTNGKRFYIEIKPKTFYDLAIIRQDMNWHKWEAAKLFSSNHGFEFKVVTEEGLRLLNLAWGG